MSPREAKTFDQICALKRDNYPSSNAKFSILLSEGSVSLHQPNGVGYYSIPRREWNAIVDWYMRDQHTNKRKRKP